VVEEKDGRRGSSEIGMILYRYLSGLPVTVKEVILYSDSCTGQNRNQFITAVLLHAVQVLHIDIIEQKFSVPGRDVKLGFFLQPKLDCSKPNINRSSKYSG